MRDALDAIESFPYDESFHRVEKPLLAARMASLWRQSDLHAEYYEKLGFSEKDIGDPGNFSAVPLTHKDLHVAEQQNHPPYGRLAKNAAQERLRRVHVTSGTTGHPFYVILTEADLADTLEAGRRAFLCAGLRPEDIVIHCLNYCLWSGGLTDHLSLEATGATVIPFGVGNSRLLIKTILHLKPTSISCTPSYLAKLEVLAREEFGIPPAALGIKKAFLGGEGGLQDPKVRARYESAWNLRAIDANYGMADILSIFGAECDARRGLHFHGQGILHFELIDPETRNPLPVQDGQVGEMVLTTLKKEAQPFVRYRTRDVVKIVSTEPCSCGRKSFRFLVMGRSDDMMVVRGVNVYPGAIAALLADYPGDFSGEYEIILDSPPPIERPLLRIELAGAAPAPDLDRLKAMIVHRCKSDLQFTPRLELVTFGVLPRVEGKTQRIKRPYVKQ